MFAYCGNNPANHVDPSGNQFGSVGSHIKSTYFLAPGQRGTALQMLQREAGNNRLSPEFELYSWSGECCGGMMYGKVLSGNISGPSITHEGLTLINTDVSMIRCYIEWDHHKVSIGDMLNVNVSANISGSGASLGAMVSAWSPSITVYTDKGTFVYTLYVGAIGYQATYGYDNQYGFAIAPCGIGFGFSYER